MPVAYEQAYLPSEAPSQVDVRCMSRDWLRTRAKLWPRSFNRGPDTRGLLA